MATLAEYLQRTQRLLDDVTIQRFNPYDLIEYVNEGRLQIAGEASCTRASGTLTTTAAQQIYTNTSIVLPSNKGFAGTLSVERIRYVDSNSTQVNPILLEARPWPWFDLHFLTLGTKPTGLPRAWSQYTQGPAGSFYLAPVPASGFSLTLDVVAFPLSLGASTVATDIDAIPYPWSDAVAFYAASLALSGVKMPEEAAAMMQQYKNFIGKAGVNVTPPNQPRNFPDRSVAVSRPPAQAEPR